MISFVNGAESELFKYYDSRNKTRLNKLKTKAGITKDQTHELKTLGSTILSILKKIQSVGEQNGNKNDKDRHLPIDKEDVKTILEN